MPQAVRQPDPLQPVLGFGAGVGRAGQFERQHHVLDGVQRRQQLEGLKDETQQAAAQDRPRIFVERTEIASPASATEPLLGRSRPASRPSRVDFPEPEAPTIATVSPGRRRTKSRAEWSTARRRYPPVWRDHSTSMTIDASRPMSRIPNYRSLLLAGLMLIAPAHRPYKPSSSSAIRCRRATASARTPPGPPCSPNACRKGSSIIASSMPASREKPPAAAVTRIDAALARHSPQVVIIALGANDGLRGLPVAQLRDNLTAIVSQRPEEERTACCWSASASRPIMAPTPGNFIMVFGEVAKARKTALVDFLLEGVATEPHLFQSDNLHPTAEAQPLLLNNVWRGLAPLLK
jgi:hypothetical protein